MGRTVRNEPVLPFGLIHGNASRGYAVFATVDEYGRRGELTGVSRDEVKAKAMANRVGYYSSEGETVEGTLFDGPDGLIFIETAFKVPQVDANLPEILRREKEAALAKLTPREQELLGVSK